MASQSLQSFRHMQPEPRILFHDRVSVRKLEREAYYGGISLPYYLGRVVPEINHVAAVAGQDGRILQGPVYHCDVTSLYPVVMRDNLFPYKFEGRSQDFSVVDLKNHLERYAVIAGVHVNSEERAYPVRRKIGGQIRTQYCRGHFWTVLAGPELKRALFRDEIAAVSVAAWYHQAPIFREWATKLLAEKVKARQEERPFDDWILKNLLVALHGKLGQHGQHWVDCPSMEAPVYWGQFPGVNPEDGSPATYRALGELQQIRAGESEHPKAFPAIPAYVTAYAREKMNQHKATIGAHHVLYQCVDSFHLLHNGWKRAQGAGLVDDFEPGKFRLKDTWEQVTYRGANNFEADGHDYVAGLAMNREKLPSGLYRVREWERGPNVINRPPDGSVHVQSIEKSLPEDYPGGSLGEDGWVTPFYLGETDGYGTRDSESEMPGVLAGA